MSPFEANLGWDPESLLELFNNQHEDTVQTLNDFKKLFEASFHSPTSAQKLAQSRQAAYNASLYTPPMYKEGDMVYFSKKLFTDPS